MKWRVGTEAERRLERWLRSFRREKVVTPAPEWMKWDGEEWRQARDVWEMKFPSLTQISTTTFQHLPDTDRAMIPLNVPGYKCLPTPLFKANCSMNSCVHVKPCDELHISSSDHRWSVGLETDIWQNGSQPLGYSRTCDLWSDLKLFVKISFIVVHICNIKLTIWTIFKCMWSSTESIDNVVQPSPLYISRTLPSSQTELHMQKTVTLPSPLTPSSREPLLHFLFPWLDYDKRLM